MYIQPVWKGLTQHAYHGVSIDLKITMGSQNSKLSVLAVVDIQ